MQCRRCNGRGSSRNCNIGTHIYAGSNFNTLACHFYSSADIYSCANASSSHRYFVSNGDNSANGHGPADSSTDLNTGPDTYRRANSGANPGSDTDTDTVADGHSCSDRYADTCTAHTDSDRDTYRLLNFSRKRCGRNGNI